MLQAVVEQCDSIELRIDCLFKSKEVQRLDIVAERKRARFTKKSVRLVKLRPRPQSTTRRSIETDEVGYF